MGGKRSRSHWHLSAKLSAVIKGFCPPPARTSLIPTVVLLAFKKISLFHVCHVPKTTYDIDCFTDINITNYGNTPQLDICRQDIIAKASYLQQLAQYI